MTAIINLETYGLSKSLVEYFESDGCSSYLAFHPELLECICSVRGELSNMELEELVKAIEYYAQRNSVAEITIPSIFDGFGEWFEKAFKWILWGCLAALGGWLLVIFTPYLISLGQSLASMKRAKTRNNVAKLDYSTEEIVASSDVNKKIIEDRGFEQELSNVVSGKRELVLYKG